MAGMRRRMCAWGVVCALALPGCAGHPEAEEPAAAVVAAPPTKGTAPDVPPEAPIEAVPNARELGLRYGRHKDRPGHEAIVDARGEVWYYGEPGWSRVGLHTGHVTVAAVHRALRRALDEGFMNRPEEDVVEGQPVYVSMALERRKAVVGTFGILVHEIEMLLAQTTWDEVPRVDPPDPAACPALARAIAGRCQGFLRLKEQVGDCVLWLDLADTLVARDGPELALPQRCARHLRSLQASEREVVPRKPPKLARRCREWHGQKLERCLPWLEKGEFPFACGNARAEIGEFWKFVSGEAEGALEPGDVDATQWCDEHIGGFSD